MDFRKIVLIPTADNLEQAGVLRLRQLVAPHTQVEVFEPVYDPHLATLPAGDISSFEAVRDEVVGARLRRAEAIAESLRDQDIHASAAAIWDYPLYGYHKPYGTGYALLALALLAPKDER